MGFYSRYGQITLAGASLTETSYLQPIFPGVYFLTICLPFCGRRGKSFGGNWAESFQTLAKPWNVVKHGLVPVVLG
jgi:hypothetical protein